MECGWALTSRQVRTLWRRQTACSLLEGYCARPLEIDGAGRQSMTSEAAHKNQHQDEAAASRVSFVLNSVTVTALRLQQTLSQ